MLDSASTNAMIAVKDLSRAKEFYNGKLGLRHRGTAAAIGDAVYQPAGGGRGSRPRRYSMRSDADQVEEPFATGTGLGFSPGLTPNVKAP
jgi:catechol 2,3-dioxygenase-like lactoylglutathione lyase family enzyme